MKLKLFLLTTICSIAFSCTAPRENSVSNNQQNRSNQQNSVLEGQAAAAAKTPEADKAVNEKFDSKDDSVDDSDDDSALSSTPSGRTENRCGWYSNPTPGNHWLEDKDGEWIIGTQGGRQAEGDYPPEFADDQWIKTNINYGYGCACLKVQVDKQKMQITKVVSASARPLSACRNDKALKEPSE